MNRIDWEEAIAVRPIDNPAILAISLLNKLLDFCNLEKKEIEEIWMTMKRPGPTIGAKPEDMWSALSLKANFKRCEN